MTARRDVFQFLIPPPILYAENAKVLNRGAEWKVSFFDALCISQILESHQPAHHAMRSFGGVEWGSPANSFRFLPDIYPTPYSPLVNLYFPRLTTLIPYLDSDGEIWWQWKWNVSLKSSIQQPFLKFRQNMLVSEKLSLIYFSKGFFRRLYTLISTSIFSLKCYFYQKPRKGLSPRLYWLKVIRYGRCHFEREKADPNRTLGLAAQPIPLEYYSLI